MSKSFYFAVVNWPNSELCRAFVCMIRYFSQSVTIKLAHVFMVAGWWVTVDFDSKYKILWGETRAHGVLVPYRFLLMKKQIKTRICLIIPTPYNIILAHVGVEGEVWWIFLDPDPTFQQ